MAMFVGLAALTVLVIIVYETEVLMPGVLAGNEQAEFLQTAAMELATLACAFLGLRLFKFRQIHDQLVTLKEPALLKYGVLRLLIIQVPMLSNTLYYYMYMKPTFGYLAIILALCLPFVWPSMNRCLAETTDERA